MRLTSRLVLVLLLAFGPRAAVAEDLKTLVLAGGCFWCVEADFDKVRGVTQTISGFSGGRVDNPTYRQVVSGGTGHLEVVEITYDADRVSYAQLVHLFLRSINPLDAGGQFCDRGESYSTAIFAETDAERAAAEAAIADASAALGRDVVTPVRDRAPFYAADSKHQDYYKKNPLRYGIYRQGCGRDEVVRDIWGEDAPFAKSS